MKKIENIWDIPRSDKTERCAKCLKAFYKDQQRIRSKEFHNCRFEFIHLDCKK